MSAALSLPLVWARATPAPQLLSSAVHHIQRRQLQAAQAPPPHQEEDPAPTWAFYRKHTEKLLKRYLYASMQVGRSPSILGESVDRGWVSSRKVRTFEDALIFVLDVERCLNKLTIIDRQLITRVLIQEYTHSETAPLLGLSTRTVCNRVPQATDRLTEIFVASDLLDLPD